MSTQGERLRQARIKAGFKSVAAAARENKLHYQNLYDHENDRRGISPDFASKYSNAFNVSASFILTGEGGAGRMVSVVGYVGAGAEVLAIDDHAKGAGLDQIEAPPGSPERAVAVTVRGDSMWPAYNDGDHIVYAERTDDVRAHLNRECVVWLDDGRVFVKMLTPGSEPDHFTLVSYNAPAMLNQRVVSAAPILWVKKF